MTPMPETPAKRDTLYLQVLAGIALGVLVGLVAPASAAKLKLLGDVFLRMVKMLIAPIIFCTVSTGIAAAGNLRKVGRVGLKALVYFEAMTTCALVVGLLIVHAVRPGDGIHADAATLSTTALDATTHGQEAKSFVDHLVAIVPDSFVGAFVDGEILQVLFVAILAGLGIARLGERGARATAAIESATSVLFAMMALIMRLAPIGAFGAMAYTIGRFGLSSLGNLLGLMLSFYATSLIFVFGVLGLVVRSVAGLSIFKLVRYLRDELLLVLGTSSSEPALPRLMDKLEAMGCDASVVRIVIPTGYSFNLDGTSIYLTMAAGFVAQALDVHLSLGHELALLAVLLLTSKGAAAVTGGGFITLAATLQTTRTIPVAGLSLLVGIDRFMSEARALTNLVGNAVAAIVVSRWERAFDVEKARDTLADGRPMASELARS